MSYQLFGEDDLGASNDNGELLYNELIATTLPMTRKMSARANN